jgi:DNA-binding transcriptional MerR regulator
MSVDVQTVESSSTSALLSLDRKSPTAFRTISEVADDLALPQHVLRFWESKFPQQIKPLKRGGGRRYYRPDDIKIIHDIKDLLYNQGFTIRGVQKLMRENNTTSVARSKVAQPQLPIGMQTLPLPSETQHAPVSTPVITASRQTGVLSPEVRREMEGVLAELRAMRKILHQSGI